jgi:phage-related protein
MAFDGSDECWKPDIPVERENEWRLKIAQFGDGYAQRSLDGINALVRKWQVTFAMREAAVINAMDAYLVAQKANSFSFLEPASGVLYSVFCDAWTVSWDVRRRGDVYYGSLSAEFVLAYGITA